MLKMDNFRLSIKIKSTKDLISNCLKKEPNHIGQNMKDAHMNTIGEEFILISVNKNAHVVTREANEAVAELNLKNREMACSLVFQNVLLIGTYVDTLFVFSITDFSPLFSMRSNDSILTMCVISDSHNFLALGQAGGYIDVLKLQGTQRSQGMIVSSLAIPEAGYINKITLSTSQNSMLLACERGVFFLCIDDSKKSLLLT